MNKLKRAIAEVLIAGIEEGKYQDWYPENMDSAMWTKPYEFPLPDKLQFNGYMDGKGSIDVIWGKDPKGNQVHISDNEGLYSLILQNVDSIFLEDEYLSISAQVVDAGYGENLCSHLSIPVTGGHVKPSQLRPSKL